MHSLERLVCMQMISIANNNISILFQVSLKTDTNDWTWTSIELTILLYLQASFCVF